jgi:SNF2 family DNA or RNA helicase
MKVCNHPNCNLPVQPYKLDRFCKEHDRLYYLLNKLTAVLYKEPSITKEKFIDVCEGKYTRQDAYDVAAKLIGMKVGKADNKEKLCKAVIENLDKAPIPIEKEEVLLEEEKHPLTPPRIALSPLRLELPKEEKKREEKKKKKREEEKIEAEEEKKEIAAVEEQLDFALHSKYNLSELMKSWDVEKTGATLSLFEKYQHVYKEILAISENLKEAIQSMLYKGVEEKKDESSREVRKLQQLLQTKQGELQGYRNTLKNFLLNYFKSRDINCIARSKKALRDHQKLVINTMMEPTSRGLLVVHGVGTGKTLTAVTASQCFLDAYPDGIVNVITPTSLQVNMKKEMMAFGLKGTISRDASGNIKKITLEDERIRFYTYKGFMKDEQRQCVNSLLIVDEAHNLRTPQSKQANAVRDCALQATKVLLLTATPIVNGPRDILMLMSMINPDLVPIANNPDAKVPTSKEMAERFGCRVSMYEAPKQVEAGKDSDYPEQRNFDYFFPMSHTAYQEYLKFEKSKNGQELMQEFEHILRASREGYIKMFKETDHLETFMNGLRRASNVLEGEHGPKYQFIAQKLRDLLMVGTTKKYVIFSNYLDAGIDAVKHMIEKLGLTYLLVDGSMSIEKRANAVEKFNADYLGNPQEHRVIIITRAGGEGLDLKGVSDIIILEPSWNESASTQIIGRGVRYQSHLHLPKSERYVNVHRLYLIKPTEIEVTNQLKRKHENLWHLGEHTYSLQQLKADLLKEDDPRPSADLYISLLSSAKQERVLEMLENLRKVSIEELYCM